MSVWAEVAGKREKREWPSISSLAFFRRGVAVSGEIRARQGWSGMGAAFSRRRTAGSVAGDG